MKELNELHKSYQYDIIIQGKISSFLMVLFNPRGKNILRSKLKLNTKDILAGNSAWSQLGCTDTPFLASCPRPTCVGHRNGDDAPDSGVQRCPSFFLFLFFFTSPTRLRHCADAAPTQRRRNSDTPAVKKKKITDFNRWTYQYHWFCDNSKII